MKKNLLVYFLFMAFCLQNLPLQLLKQDSEKQQYATQVPADEDEEEGIKEKDSIKFCLVSHLFELTPSGEQNLLGIQAISHSIPQNHAVEIHVPPPNC
jgi:hypothetical protein